MVNLSNSNASNRVEENENPLAASRGGGGATGSWGPTGSGHSMSTSSSVGSPSSRSEAKVAATAGDSTFLLLNNLDIQGDDAGFQGTPSNRRKKRGQRAVGGDKNGRGLRQFSMKVCEKVESKGRTTYNEVADALVAEFTEPCSDLSSPDQQQYDEKNIRRRVYDALNVLMAMDIISKDKKDIQWKGLPRTSLDDIDEFKAERLGLRNRIEKKAAYLEELEEQYIGLQKLVLRNKQLYGSGNAPNGGVALPFILVKTRPHATVEVEISEDMQLVHFDFSSTPFELHDDNYVLKAMKLCGKPQNNGAPKHIQTSIGESSSMVDMYQSQMAHQSRPNLISRPPHSTPLPGILKARVKHEQ